MSADFYIKADFSKEVERAAEQQIKAALEAAGLQMQEDIAQRTPVDTGRLKASMTHKVADRHVDVGTNVEYAPYVEYGTSRMAPRHFMKNAIEANKKKYEEILKNYLKG